MSDNKNSMLEKCDGRFIANQALMNRGSHSLEIFVEGENDEKCLSRFFNDKNVRINPSYNKHYAIEALRCYLQSKKKKKAKAISIVDSDYDTILKVNHDKGVFLTDDHDLLVQAINSNALKAVLKEKKKKDKTDIDINDLKRKLYESCKTLGYLRLINSEDNLGINFSNKSLVKHENNSAGLISQIFTQQKQTLGIKKKELLTKLKNKKSELHSLNIICQGHDMCLLLSSIIEISSEKIEKLLMHCYDFRCFKKTKLFNDLKEWGDLNSIDLFEE